jgi:hypothetical protein
MPYDIVTSPNMNLQVPSPGNTQGPQWATALYTDLYSIIDQHNHSTGQGVPIGANGISLTSNLPLNNNSLTTINSLVFTPQTSVTTLDALYVQGVDLYFTDGNGHVVQLTSGGLVNATSSGISSGTASASFSGSTLVVNEASNTPGNVQCGSVLIGNNLASSNFVTLEAPAALASSYDLVLPLRPASVTSFVTIDTSGNMGTASSISPAQIASGSITGSQIASATITGSNIASGTVTGSNIGSGTVTGGSGGNLASGTVTNSNLAALNYAESGSIIFSTNATSFTGVIGLTATLTTVGRPVFVGLISDNASASTDYGIVTTTSINGALRFLTDGSQTGVYQISDAMTCPASMFSTILTSLGAGSHTFTCQVANTGGAGTFALQYVKLIAYEL